jgi:signal transduction histidine kinase
MATEVKSRLVVGGRVLALAAIYFAAARAGLALEAVAGFATLVWPPTGISIAALLIFGYRVWPGVLLGAVAANAASGAPLLVALAIGIGNTLEAVTATYVLRRVSGFRPSLDHIRDAISLILAAALGSLISATIGVTSLYAGSIVSRAGVPEAFGAWWLGDLIGALVVAPLILIWSTRPLIPKGRADVAEAVALAISVIVVGVLIFTATPRRDSASFGQVYMLFPLLIWAALRFGPRAVVTSVFVVSLLAIWGTTQGHGPFVHTRLYESLFALQTFMAVVAATFLLLGASIAERRKSAAELRIAHRAADEANRAKSDFIAVMSHELRTPLNAIAGYVELLLLDVDGPVTDKQRESLLRIQRNEEHLLTLINDVLDFARVEAGQQIFSIGKVAVAEALQSLEPLIEPDVRRKDIGLVFTPTDPALAARADGEKMRRILLNFASNAVKFTPPGGQVWLGAAAEDGRVRIWVRDNGIGVPADQLDHVFDPFVQMDVGKTRRYEGVGLGLTIARDLARGMNGEARLERNESGGCTAVLLLPSA